MAVAISGIGVISAIGKNVQENLASIKSKNSGIAPIENLKDLRKPYLSGQVKLSDEELKASLELPLSRVVPRSTLLSMVAAKEAWGDREHDSALRTGIISATSVGGMELSERFYFDYKVNESLSLLENLSVHDNGAGTNILADYLKIKTYKFTVSTACSSAANAILLGARLIEGGILDRVLVGGGDAISNFTLNGFDSLGIFDKDWCRPFDENRKGLNLGEAAGFLVLENEKAINEGKAKSLAHLVGWANANDSYHQTASSPNGLGATLAIKKAIKKAEISFDQIDYINAHGTATPNNDLSESIALQNVFGSQIPPFSSTKAYTGHTLAASGGIEAVFSVLAIQQGLMFPNLNYSTSMKETNSEPITELVEKDVNFVLSNSFGFGGNSTSLIFSK